MSSKADYLKKYLSAGDTTDPTKKDKKKRKKIKKRANLAIHDDDVDWKTLIPTDQPTTEEEDEHDETPQVVDYKDDTKAVKWQPVIVKSEDEDPSPPRRSRLDSPDLSPPRIRRRRDSDNDLSPPRKKKTHRTDRHSKKRHASPELVKIGKRQRQNSDDNGKQDSVENSPPRRKRHDSVENSPPRRKRHDSDVDQSPPRRNEQMLKDLSPPRKSKQSSDLSPPRDKSSKEKMSSGATAGLQNAQALKEENAMVRKRQEEYFKSLDPSLSGKHANTVYRDKQGKKIDPKMEKMLQREKEKEMEEENERFMKWGRGAAQSKSHEERLQDDIYEMSKPLARYADDEDLEKMLKDRERAGDPMLAYLKKPVSKDTTNKKTIKERPTYKGSVPPNRYSIKPGYRWDGVNRSNGYEKTLFARESNKVAVAEEAYKWSVEDM